MKGTAVAGLVVVVIIIGAGIGYLVGAGNQQTRILTDTTTKIVTTTSSMTATATTTSFIPDLGSYLQLRIKMNASVIPSHGAIWVQVILSNPLDSNLTATVPGSRNSTVANWSWDDFMCGDGYMQYIASFALFQGYYVAENLSLAGEPLALTPPVEPPCLNYQAPLYVVYHPTSSSALVYSGYPQIPPFTLQTILNATTEVFCAGNSGSTICGQNSGLFGYWQGPSGSGGNWTTSSPDFHYFSPGQYTLVAEDAWGHQAFSYFEVA
jgi:hypothetical protein